MRKTLIYIFCLFSIFLSHCTSKKGDNPEVLYIRKKISQIEADMAQFESKMKDADHGLQTKLTQDQELNKARLARLKEALQKAEDNQKKLE